MRASTAVVFSALLACAPPIAEAPRAPNVPSPKSTSAQAAVQQLEPIREPPPRFVPFVPYVPFAPEGRSLRVKRSIVVRAEPFDEALPIGTLAQDMRVTWKRAIAGPDCAAWVEIEPRGWVCDRYLEDNVRLPRARTLPLVEEGALTPGEYARVVGKRARAYPTLRAAKRRRGGRRLVGSVTVELVAEVKLGRRTYWRTRDREYIEARYLRQFEPSDFVGLDAEALDGLEIPLAFAQRRGKERLSSVTVYAHAAEDALHVGTLAPRTAVKIFGRSEDGTFALIAPDEWVRLDDLHLIAHTPPPLESAPDERWIDIDLDEQVLVAWEGERPVLATLISSGSRGHETPEGLFRVWIKFAETTMNSRMGEPAYKVSRVPWTMFFFEDFALHTSYWHDRFGEPASHGCINLAPRDARTLYEWATPEVPDGWSMSYATANHPGSTIRVRSRRWLSPLLPATFARIADAR